MSDPVAVSPVFLKLFIGEMKAFCRQRSVWLIAALLSAAMTWAVSNGQRQAQEQHAAIERIREREAEAIRQQKADIARYARPAETRLAYWLDPTDISGYMRYHLVAFAIKPPSVLGGLAMGQGKLLPFYLRVELDHVTPPDAAFDFVNPRVLSLGGFDLPFVLIYLLPLGLIVLAGSRLSSERDSGALRLLVSQAASARQLVALRFGAVAAVCLPGILALLACAWTLGGTWPAEAQAWGALGMVALASLGYSAFWIGLIALVASRTGVVASHTLLVSLWAAFTFLIPAGSALILDVLHPLPSRLTYLNELRHQGKLIEPQRRAIAKAYFEARPAYASAANRLAQVDYATTQIAVQEEMDRRMQTHTEAAKRARTAANTLANVLRWLSPATLVGAVLETAAGTDARRHEDFLHRFREHTGTLRGFFWPKALQEAARPSYPCDRCAGRLNFTQYDRIPRYRADAPLEGVTERLVGWTLYLWLSAAAVALLLWRTKQLRF